MSVTAEPVNHVFGVNLSVPFTVIGITLFAYYFWKKSSKRYKLIRDIPGPELSYTELLYQAVNLEPKGT